MMCCFCCMGQFMGENPKTCFRRSAVACKRLRYAPCVTLQTLCVALLFILDLHYAEHALLSHVINCAFDQTNAFYLFVCLMLVYSFSPRVHSIRGVPFLTSFQVLGKTQKGANYRFLIASTGFFRAILSTGIKLAKSAVAMQPRRIIPTSRIP